MTPKSTGHEERSASVGFKIDASSSAGAAEVQKSSKDDLEMSTHSFGIRKLSWLTKVVYGAPTAATVPFIALWSVYGNKNYEEFGASLSLIALFTALARSFDVISDPLVSHLTDTARTRYGRRRPFMLIGCVFYSAFLYLLLNPPYSSPTFLSVWFGVTYALFFIADTFTNIPYNALGPELSEDSNERTSLFFVSGLFDGFGTLVALGLPSIMMLLARETNVNDDVCKPELEQAALCLEGRTCRDFIASGSAGVFSKDEALSAVLSPLAGLLAAPIDTTRRCAAFAGNGSLTLLSDSATAVQNEAFCDCVTSCADACDMAVKRSGFSFVGIIFALWYVATCLICVYYVKERQPSEKEKHMPLVPSLLSASANGPFRILLPAWVFDAVCRAIVTSIMPFFVEVVVQPSFLTKEHDGIDCAASSSSYEGGIWVGLAGRSDWRCDSFKLLTVCFIIVLLSAIVALPIWNFLVRKIGKIRCWLLVSLCYAVSFMMMIFLFKGWINFMLIIAVFQGFPVAGTFLSDGILADIIDYDEFLTASRSEATYTMFKSFLPKIVQIPTSALPLAFLATVGYREKIGSTAQEQPVGVQIFMKGIALLCIISAISAYCIKRRYPLKTDDDVEEVSIGIAEHRKGKPYPDPITGQYYQPLEVATEEEETVALLYHFRLSRLESAFAKPIETEKQANSDSANASVSFDGSSTLVDIPSDAPNIHTRVADDRPIAAISKQYTVDISEGTRVLVRFANVQLIACTIFGLVSVVGAAVTFPLLQDKTWGFIPTLAVILVGICATSTLFVLLRKRAASRLRQMCEQGELSVDFVARVLWHRATVAEIGVEHTTSAAYGGSFLSWESWLPGTKSVRSSFFSSSASAPDVQPASTSVHVTSACSSSEVGEQDAAQATSAMTSM